MRFLTLDWWRGGLSDEEAEAASASYKHHFDRIKDRLPKSILDLWESFSLHDGNLVGLRWNTESQGLQMVVDGWNSFSGECRMLYELNFTGVQSFSVDSSRNNERCQRSGFDDLGYYEVDIVADNTFRMDFLFWSGIEISVTFASLDLKASPIAAE